MKNFFSRFAKFEFGTAFGALGVWTLASLLLLASFVFGDAPSFPEFVCWACAVLWGLSVLGVIVAFLMSLANGQLGRALVQFVLGVLGMIAFLVGTFFANIVGWELSERKSDGEDGWRSSPITEQIPFAVEYRNAHPFLAEYDKRIVFKSGKKIGVRTDTGGGGPFAVYALDDGRFYLADGLDCDFMRHDYRVSVDTEKVEINLYGVWAEIPDGTKEVCGMGSDYSLSVKTGTDEDRYVQIEHVEPIGKTLDGRRFLGYIRPSGKFEVGLCDPFAGEAGRCRMGLEPEWKACGLSRTLPFDIEDGKRLDRHSRRIRFRSGKTFGVGYENFENEACAIYKISPDEYNVVRGCDKDVRLQWSYRLNVSNETVDLEYHDHWLRLPEGTLSVQSMGCGESKDGRKQWQLKAQTAEGPAEGWEIGPAGDYKSRREPVGTLTKDGVFEF